MLVIYYILIFLIFISIVLLDLTRRNILEKYANSVVARYVKLVVNRNECMNLVEVKVYGAPISSSVSSSSSGENVAKGKPVTASSTYRNDMVAGNLTDGSYSTMAHTSCKENPWIEIDLKESFSIEKLEIFNRLDCCSERILGCVVYLMDAKRNIVFISDPIRTDEPYYVLFPPNTCINPLDPKKDCCEKGVNYKSYSSPAIPPPVPLPPPPPPPTSVVVPTVNTPTVPTASDGEYPPSPMTANTCTLSNGTYIATLVPNDLWGAAYHSFDKSQSISQANTLNQFSGDGTYKGSNSTTFIIGSSTNVVKGDWIQLQMPQAINLGSYSLASAPGYPSRSPKSMRLLGSTDGKTWYHIDVQTGLVWNSSGEVKQFTVTTSMAFNYFRLVDFFHNSGDNGNSLFAELRFFTVNYSPKFTLAINDGQFYIDNNNNVNLSKNGRLLVLMKEYPNGLYNDSAGPYIAFLDIASGQYLRRANMVLRLSPFESNNYDFAFKFVNNKIFNPYGGGSYIGFNGTNALIQIVPFGSAADVKLIPFNSDVYTNYDNVDITDGDNGWFSVYTKQFGNWGPLLSAIQGAKYFTIDNGSQRYTFVQGSRQVWGDGSKEAIKYLPASPKVPTWSRHSIQVFI